MYEINTYDYLGNRVDTRSYDNEKTALHTAETIFNRGISGDFEALGAVTVLVCHEDRTDLCNTIAEWEL
jgi:hypothetical protein